MGNYEQLKQAVSDVIKTNGNQEITGDILQNTLLSIISTVGGNATFAGIATPTTNPGTPDQNVFYIASQNGTYSNFGGVTLENQVVIFSNANGSWEMADTGIATEQAIIYDVSARNNNAVFESLQALLSSSNLSTLIPASVRCGGMSIRFIQGQGSVLNFDNKYIQYLYHGTSTNVADFTNTNNWEKTNLWDRVFNIETLLNESQDMVQPSAIINPYCSIKYSDGSLFSQGNQDYKVSDFIDVSLIDSISYSIYNGYANTALIAAYDANKNYIQSNSVNSVAAQRVMGKWIKASGTAYIRFSRASNEDRAYIGNYHKSLEEDRENYANEFASIGTKFDNIKSSINELCVLKYGTNYQTLNADGSLNTAVGNPNTYVTGYIDVSLIDFIKYSIEKQIFNNPQCVIAAYNENKEFISANSIIANTSSRYEGVWEKGSTTKFIRIGFNQSVDVTSSAIISGRVVKGIVSNLDIVAFGDSLTEGAGSQTGAPTQRIYPFTEHLKTFINAKRATPCNMVNAGVGGEASWNIGYRQGGLGVMVMPFTIPSTTTAVEVTLKGQYDDYSYYNSMWNLDVENAPHTWFAVTGAARVNPVKIDGIEGTLSVSDGKYYFTRTSAGNAITLTVPTFLETFASRNYKDYIQIIWVGTNDAPLINGQYVMQEGLNERIKDMIMANNTRKYIVLGLTNGSTESNVVTDMSFIKSFGSHFLNIREYLSKYGITIANEQGAGIEITPTVEQNIDNGIIDTSLKVDGVHGNYYFYYAVARAIYEKGVSLNYWE